MIQQGKYSSYLAIHGLLNKYTIACFRTPERSVQNTQFDSEEKQVFKEMVLEFEKIFYDSIKKSRNLNVQLCSKEQCSDLLRKSGELREICDQAIDSTDSLKSDVQTLRLSLYEALVISAEAQSRMDLLNNPK